MDERELETLFQDGPGEAPPATFDADHVALASARARYRTRRKIVLASSCVVLLLAGLGIGGVLLGEASWTEPATNVPAVAEGQDQPPLTPYGQPGSGSVRPPNAVTPHSFPSSPKQGGDESGKNGPRAESTSGCDKVDRELATALAGELPAAATNEPRPARVCVPAARSVGFAVHDGSVAGMVSVAVLPRGVAIQLPPQPSGTVSAQAPAATGTVLVFSTPDGHAQQNNNAPFAARVHGIAVAIAGRS